MSRALRIALVSRRVHPAHGPGGLERHVHDQARHLARAGVRVELFTETAADPARRAATERAFPAGVSVHWVDPSPLPLGRVRGTVVLDRVTNYPAWARRAGRALPPDVDVVHVHGLGGLGAADRARAGSLVAPLVLTTHGMEEFVAPGLKGWAYARFRRGMRRIAAAADSVVVTDDALLPVVRAGLAVPADRLVVIPNAIDPETCRAAASAAAASAVLGPLRDADPLFVSVGRIAPNKGFAVAVQAFARSAGRLPDRWGWALIGDGPERGQVEREIRRAGLNERCRLVGAVDDATKHGILARAAWFVHPTLYEGSSLATLEAMAHGLPVIASRAGGLPDKVHEGVTGLLVAPGDVDALAAALARSSALDRSLLGAAGSRLLADRFSWKAATVRYLELYATLVGQG